MKRKSSFYCADDTNSDDFIHQGKKNRLNAYLIAGGAGCFG